MSDDHAALEVRLRRLEDLEEIRRLFDDYGYYLDRGRYEEYASLYAADGKMRLGPARADGREEIARVAGASFGGSEPARPGGLDRIHIVSSPRIELDGDRATAEVAWTVISRGEDGKPVVTGVGHHADDLVHEDGRWRFARRRGFYDIP